MGFGSYDESEQQHQTVDPDDDHEGVSVSGNEHSGSVQYEMDSSTQDLVDKLQDIKAEE